MKILGKLVIAIFISAMAAMAVADEATKAKYAPYQHPFPQIIQNSDYSTILSVEYLFNRLSAQNKENALIDVSEKEIVFRFDDANTNRVHIRQADQTTVIVDRMIYTNTLTVAMYSTLIRVLSDLSAKEHCEAVKYSAFGTRAYKQRTIVEFKYASGIVSLDAFSNGPKDEERLYILNLYKSGEDGLEGSFFW